MGFPKGRRAVAALVAVLLGVGAAAVVGYRVLAPAEVETVARASYPAAITPNVGVVGRLPVAPLIVDGRLRVYAADRQVYADQPADSRHRVTPYWSYRRWPARLSGVVADGTTVVSQWSDGKLVALDARTGRVAWRADAAEPGVRPKPRRTYAATVWEPSGLSVAHTATGRTVLVVAGAGQLGGYDLVDGRRLWRVDQERGCLGAAGTTASGGVLGLTKCAGPETVEFRDAVTGALRLRWRPPGAPDVFVVTPVGCRQGRSGCRGLRISGGDGSGQGWLVGGGAPLAAPGLDGVDTALDGERAVGTSAGVVTGRSARTGAELWQRADLGRVRIIAAEPGRVHLLTERRDLVTLDPATGAERSRFALTIGADGIDWQPGRAYATGGYVAVERAREGAGPDDDDQAYFRMAEPVLLAAT
ncbi:PQQ-like domain-containing protein [Micromonospora viridifaciens]|uniref:PQQ-like domain-containing protein n=1 Tax=Micromonospora viridifaciens TaxID=1881 RepID=A0A1C4URA1_MICVI|nr:PQQ-binding-like beta-propeller repeat protein [Micromonospora viridifaciens]SCE74175.1 PQQ-like domain-containing protein [Micromonospora viridifaciens]